MPKIAFNGAKTPTGNISAHTKILELDTLIAKPGKTSKLPQPLLEAVDVDRCVEELFGGVLGIAGDLLLLTVEAPTELAAVIFSGSRLLSPW